MLDFIKTIGIGFLSIILFLLGIALVAFLFVKFPLVLAATSTIIACWVVGVWIQVCWSRE